jgi:hypothetical protein
VSRRRGYVLGALIFLAGTAFFVRQALNGNPFDWFVAAACWAVTCGLYAMAALA